jgi:hypothetical protein
MWALSHLAPVPIECRPPIRAHLSSRLEWQVTKVKRFRTVSYDALLHFGHSRRSTPLRSTTAHNYNAPFVFTLKAEVIHACSSPVSFVEGIGF